MQAAGGVDDDHVAQMVDGVLHALPGYLDRVRTVMAVHPHAHLVAERLQLIGGGGTIHVAGDEQRVVVLAFQQVGQLGRSRRLARALQAHEHDDVGNAAAEFDAAGALLSEQVRELVEDDLHHVLRRGERIEHLGGEAALLGLGDEFLDDLEVDIGLEQRQADFAHGGVDILFGQLALAAQAAEDVLKSLRKSFEHGVPPTISSISTCA